MLTLPLPNTVRVELVRVTKALFDAAPGYTYLTAFENAASQMGGVAGVANALLPFATDKPNDPETVADLVVTNLHLTGDAATAGKDYLVAQFQANPGNFGQVIVDAMNALATLVNDPVFGPAANAFNASIAKAYQYSIDPANDTIDLTTLQAADEVQTDEGGQPVVPGQTFTLTTGIDSGPDFTGTSGNDKYLATSTTLTAGDDLDGKAGTDELQVSVPLNGNLTNAAFKLKDIENVSVVLSDADSTTAHIYTMNLAQATGVEQVKVSGATAASASDTVQFDNLAGGVKVVMQDAVNINVTANYLSTATGGTSDAVNVELNNVSSTATTDGVLALDNNLEIANITTTGSASTLGDLTGVETINVTGDQDLTIRNTLATTVTKIDASNLTGALNITTGNTTAGTATKPGLTITTGSGDDVIDASASDATDNVSITTGAGDDTVTLDFDDIDGTTIKVDFGDGTKDTLKVDFADENGADPTTDISGTITGLEVVELTSDNSSTRTHTWDESKIKSGVTQFVWSGDAGDTAEFSNLANNSGITVKTDAAGITASIATNTTADVVDVTLEGATVTTLTATNYDTVNITSNTDTNNTTNQVKTISAAAASKLTISGATDLAGDGSNGNTWTLKADAEVDASAFSGDLTDVEFASTLGTYKGGSGKDQITVADGNLAQGKSFDGGAGTEDSLTVKASNGQDLGIIGLTGFETVNFTTYGANTIDFRNVTGLQTFKVAGATAAVDDLTLSRFDANATLEFATTVDQVVTSIETGTSQKVAFSAASTVTSLTLDAGTTSVTINSDDGDTNSAETMGTITTLSGTSLETITITGNDDLTITNAVPDTVTTIDASASKGDITVIAGTANTTIKGGEGADSLTGGSGDDKITGGKGDDTLNGAAGADTYVFAATGADNGLDTFSTGSANSIVVTDDKLDFSAFFSGLSASVDQNGGSGTAIQAYASTATGDVDITNKVVLLDDAAAAANNQPTAVDTATEIAALIDGTGDVFSIQAGGKAIVIAGNDAVSSTASGTDEKAYIYMVHDANGDGDVADTNEVVMVGITYGDFDIDTLTTTNFILA